MHLFQNKAKFTTWVLRVFIAVVAVSPLALVQAESDSKILSRLQKARPDFNFAAVKETPVKGIYQTEIVGGPAIYITEDGKYFFSGDFFEVGEAGIVNLAERAKEKQRAVDLASIKAKDMIIFSPKGKSKQHIYVFTDADCYYCQKLHSEIAEINALGIEVRYLAYPRAGVGSPSYRKIASAWCADDPREAITAIKSGETIADNVCEKNPVAAQFELGGRLGVRGTPALVTASGRLISGYMPAERLAAELARP